MRLIQIHISLIKYILSSFKQHKTVKDLVRVFIGILKSYPKVLLADFKSDINYLTDKNFRESQKKATKIQQLKKDFNRALKMLHYFDENLKKRGVPNWKRKQFWRDFYRNGTVRTELFNKLAEELK
jgi:uncharacterized protein YxeA